MERVCNKAGKRDEKGDRLKIAWISVMPPLTDGIAEYSFNLLNELKKDKRLKIVVIAQKNPKSNIKGLRVLNCWEKNSQISYEIINALEKEKPDIVHVQFLAGMYEKKNLPYLIKLFSYLKKFRTFATIHSDIEEIPFKIIFSHLFFRNINRFFVLDEYQKEALNKKFGIDRSKITKIPHGCYKKKKQPVKPKGNKLLCFGFIRRSKGIAEIIRAFKKVSEEVPDTQLLICGKCEDDNYLNEIKKEIKNLKLEDKIKIINKFLNEQEISKYFSEATLIVEFLTGEEGPSGSVNMATAFRKASVCADTAYLSEYVKNSKAGLIVPKKDSAKLSDTIIRLLRNRKEIIRMEKNAERYCKMNSFEEVAKKIAEEYKK